MTSFFSSHFFHSNETNIIIYHILFFDLVRFWNHKIMIHNYSIQYIKTIWLYLRDPKNFLNNIHHVNAICQSKRLELSSTHFPMQFISQRTSYLQILIK